MYSRSIWLWGSLMWGRSRPSLSLISSRPMLDVVLSVTRAIEPLRDKPFDADAHHRLAEKAAGESIVLLALAGAGVSRLKSNYIQLIITDNIHALAGQVPGGDPRLPLWAGRGGGDAESPHGGHQPLRQAGREPALPGPEKDLLEALQLLGGAEHLGVRLAHVQLGSGPSPTGSSRPCWAAPSPTAPGAAPSP